jgi:hypothetical protein
MAATLQLASLLFAGGIAPSTRLYFRGLTDWDTLAESKSEITQRPPGSDGAFGVAMVDRDSVAPSFEGLYVGASRLDALQMRKQLKAIANSKSMVDMTVTDEDGAFTREVIVQRMDLPDIRNQSTFVFNVYTVAPDPLMYGEEQSDSTGLPTSGTGLVYPVVYPIDYGSGGDDGRITLTNDGTADSYVVLSATGELDSGFSAIEVGTGREVRFERSIPLGSTVFVNGRTGRAYIDNPSNDVSGSLTRSDFPVVPAGGSTTLQFTSLGSSAGTPTLSGSNKPANW